MADEVVKFTVKAVTRAPVVFCGVCGKYCVVGHDDKGEATVMWTKGKKEALCNVCAKLNRGKVWRAIAAQGDLPHSAQFVPIDIVHLQRFNEMNVMEEYPELFEIL